MPLGERKPLGQLLRRPPRYGINAAAVPLAPGVPTYIRITDIDDSGRFAPDPKVGVAHPNAPHYRLGTGELIFARTGASVGKSYLYDARDGELVYAGFLINVAPDPNQLNPKYLALFAQTKEYWDWIGRTSVRSGQPGVNAREYAQLLVPLPDIATQDAIASAMTDVDELIATFERLIAKKQAIKQGMMQQLLTGKTRLPGFTEPWHGASLKEIVSTPITDGPHMTPRFLTVGVPFLSVNNIVENQIDWTDVRYVSPKDDEVFSRKCKPRRDDILLGKAASVGKVAVVETDRDFNIWSPLALIRVNEAQVPKFVYFQLQGPDVGRQIDVLTNASSQGNIGMGDLERIILKLPSQDEQQRIAAVLTCCEDEIGLIRRRLEKTKSIKQGMMQELLTGRTRLPVREAA